MARERRFLAGDRRTGGDIVGRPVPGGDGKLTVTESLESLKSDDLRKRRRLWIAFILLCAIGAAAATRRIVALGAESSGGASQFASLDAHFAAMAEMTLLHIVPALIFVLLTPLQFASSLRRRYPKVHRWIGRTIMLMGVVLGISALRLSAHPIGGAVEAAATILFGCLFLFCLSRAWWQIRKGRVELHREWVIRMVAIALGVATTRPIIALFFATSRLTGLTPEQFFGPAMWLGFTATYVAGEIWLNRNRNRAIVPQAVQPAAKI